MSKWLTSLCCLTPLLLGCGGGGTTGTSSGGTTPSPTVPTIKLDTQVYAEPCRGKTKPLAGVKVLLHRANGSLHSQWTTDSNGHFELQKPSDVAHVSLIYKNSRSVYNIVSEYAPAVWDLGRRQFRDDVFAEQCSCKTVSVNWTDLHRTQPEMRLQLFHPAMAHTINLTGSVTQNYCADNAGRFGVVQLLLAPTNTGPSYRKTLDLDSQANNSTLDLTIADMTPAGTLVNWTVSEAAAPVVVASVAVDSFGATGRDNLFIASASDPVRSFATTAGQARLQLFAAPSILEDSTSGTVRYTRHQRQALTGTTAVAILPKNQAVLAPIFSAAVAQLRQYSGVTIDASKAQGVDQLRVLQRSSRSERSSSSAPNASLVALDLPQEESIALSSDQPSLVRLELVGQGAGLSYSQFQQALVDRSRQTAFDATEQADDQRYESIEWAAK